MANKDYQTKIVIYLFFIFIGVLITNLIYHQVFDSIYKMIMIKGNDGSIQVTYKTFYNSDTPSHIRFAEEFFEKGRYIPHPLWHTFVFSLSKVFDSYKISAVVVSSTLIIFWLYLIYFAVNNFLKDYDVYEKLFIVSVIFFIGPLNFPWYEPNIYLGVGSPNIWHNVTLWTVKPFAFLSIWFFLSSTKSFSFKDYSLTAIFALISIIAKPSFIIMFLPAIFIFSLIKKLYLKREFLYFLTTLSLLSIVLLLFQYLNTFQNLEEGGKIIFDFLGVWSLQSDNIPLSILLALAFPILLFFLNTEIIFDDKILLSWIMVFIGLFYQTSLAQKGKYYTDGNFGWSYMIAMSFLYIFSIIKFFEIFQKLEWYKKYPLLFLLIAQTVVGTVYFYGIFSGLNPFFVSLN